MRMYDLILKKRNGLELTAEEINFFIKGYTNGEIPDYQAAAFLMAVYFCGLSARETSDLTEAMVDSGERADLSAIPGIKVDKHSTGGVGDKTTLVLVPLVAAAGVPVAKMSGRGLGHTGGTVDKLESIPGFRTSLEKTTFIEQVRQVGVAVVAQTGRLAPADKKLYALRDVTATVDSIPLIASSVMSKKIACGADAIVLDVKTGSGAFMREPDQAFALAEAMVEIGRRAGRRAAALVTDMSQPLGYAVGNALEVAEAIDTLQGRGPADLVELCLALGSQMLLLAGVAQSAAEGREKLAELLQKRAALDMFEKIIVAQGGEQRVLYDPSVLPAAAYREEIISPAGGWVQAIRAEKIGQAAMLLGAGRETKESVIDPAVGVALRKKAGERVERGEVLAMLHVNGRERLPAVRELIFSAFTVNGKPFSPVPLIYGVVSRQKQA
ncbi:MAG: pyrimidine-nucleoside phosphorylase [Peptococcaceae bacterium]|nr:MAG: pyrimidine-nucleoside phosphorylase [Peptococcaceae bacterium]